MAGAPLSVADASPAETEEVPKPSIVQDPNAVVDAAPQPQPQPAAGGGDFDYNDFDIDADDL